MPVVVISSLARRSCRAAIEALELGAVEVPAKPGGPYSVGELRDLLVVKIRAAASSCPRKAPGPDAGRSYAAPPCAAPAATNHASNLWQQSNAVIAIGGSTGGTVVIG
jgi:two-component system chemotaxis response regulator CheB